VPGLHLLGLVAQQRGRPVPHRGEGLVEADTVVAAGAGEPAVDVDSIGGHAEGGELLDLDLDVLFVGGATCVSRLW
jgi:hypothetical protein